MARPSKTQQFAIYQDRTSTSSSHIPPTPPPDSSHEPSFDDTSSNYFPIAEEDIIDTSNVLPTDDDVSRRQSAISSLPESSTETDAYTPPLTRPSFRKPDSVRSIYDRSPGRAVYHVRSRTGTPRSVRASAKGSPLARSRRFQEEAEEEKKDFPLVLLHVTLLPVELRWSTESMQEVLPPYVLENLQLLKSKVSETIAQRGILILHPKEEYELLEERLLEALELRKERVTKCGHFRSRSSIDSTISTDSGMGSSVPDSETEVCTTCQSPTKITPSKAGAGKNKWSIKVFAANGLMRASAWAAAWSEMERVDVEILPWISEDLRKLLDARLAEETLEMRRQEEEARIRDVVEFQARIGDGRERYEEEPLRKDETFFEDPFVDGHPPSSLHNDYAPETFAAPVEQHQDPTPDLPPVYARKDVPLSLLLRNYIFLLAQDKKNIAIFCLTLLALWMSLRSALAPTVDVAISHPLTANVTPMASDLPADIAQDIGSVVETAQEILAPAAGINETNEPGVVDNGLGEINTSFAEPVTRLEEIAAEKPLAEGAVVTKGTDQVSSLEKSEDAPIPDWANEETALPFDGLLREQCPVTAPSEDACENTGHLKKIFA